MSADQLKRLRWRCRRGMRELDLILARYLDDYAQTMDLGEFERFLDSTDMELYDWVTGRATPTDKSFDEIVTRLTPTRG